MATALTAVVVTGGMTVGAAMVRAAFPVTCDRAYVAVANVVTFGWYRRQGERALQERWKEDFRQAQGRPPIVLANTSGAVLPFGGITAAQAAVNFAANMSAMRCASAHRNAVAVKDLEGETVAALCPDCDTQLPPTWATASEPPRSAAR